MEQEGTTSVMPSWRLAKRTLDLSRRPCIMGILNVTPDSFSDGSRYIDLERAEDHAFRMVEEGADIIDIGGESTRPNIAPVDAEEELRRVLPLVERLAGRVSVPISVDTYKAVVAREALQAGAEIVNDISGLTFDPSMAATVAEAGAGVVVMHTRGRPDTMQKDTVYGDLIAEVIDFLRRSVSMAVAAGVARDRIAVDPGIGFAKSVQGNLEILRRLEDFSLLHLPILVGTSRKSFIGTVLGRNVDARLFGTAATVALAVANGASVIRVHDVREMRDVADMAHAVLHPDAY
jgi:dihydropteroate synthase